MGPKTGEVMPFVKIYQCLKLSYEVLQKIATVMIIFENVINETGAKTSTTTHANND